MPQDDVVQDGPGRCPICGMDLVPTRIDIAYTCPNHPAIMRDEPGNCPLDRRELVRVNVAVHWQCGDSASQHFLEPGMCANGSERTIVRELRAHGDHNPRYGGSFFMASDNWHHIEGTYPRAGLIRMYLYDNFTTPMTAEGVTGRIVTKEEFVASTRTYRELESFPLRPSADGKTLEAPIANDSLPLTVTAKVTFDDKTPEQRFDFTFPAYSVAPPVAPPTTTTAAPAPAAAPRPAAAPAQTAQSAPAPPPAPMPMPMPTGGGGRPTLTNCEPNMSRTDVLLMADSLPAGTPDLLKLLGMCRDQIEMLIASGQFGYIYQPTMLGKDIALVLDERSGSLAGRQKAVAADASRRIVIAAWMLDNYGDTGNRQKLSETYERLAAAVADVEAAYAQ
jgi:hypothetical protein